MKIKMMPRPVGWIRFLVLFAVVFWLWWVLRSYLLFAGLLLMVVSVIFSVCCMRRAAGRLRADAGFPGGQVEKANMIPMRIRIGRLSGAMRFMGAVVEIRCSVRNVFCDEGGEAGEKLFAVFCGDTLLSYEMESRFAGLVEFKICPVRVYDWFGMFWCEAKEEVLRTAVIFPARGACESEILQEQIENFPGEEELRKRGADSQPSGEVREYVPGDELKNIHWKLTAKQGRTMVRERTAQGREKINVLLTFSTDPAENDRRMDALYAVCALLLKKEYPVQLFWPAAGGSALSSRLLAEENDLEIVLTEILANGARGRCAASREDFEAQYPGEHYVLIRPGARRGEYV